MKTKNNIIKISLFIITVTLGSVFLSSQSILSAAVCTWNGSVDGNWGTDGNWDDCSVPVDGDELVFPLMGGNTTLVNDLPAGRQFNGLTVGWGVYSFSGNSIDLRGDFIFDDDDSNGDFTFSLDIEVVTDYLNIIVSDEPTTMYLNGVISGDSGPDIYKKGPGGLTFDGSSGNTYLGDTIVEEGILRLNKSSGISIPSSVITVGDSVGDDDSAQIILQTSDQLNADADLYIRSDGRVEIGNNTNNLNNVTIEGGNLDLGTTTILGTVSMDGGRMRATNSITAQLANGSFTCSERDGENAIIEGDPFNITASTFTINSDSTGDIDCEFISQLQGSADIVINGKGISFQGSNTFTGELTVNADSALEITHANALGNSSSGTTVNFSGVLCLANSITVAAEPISIYGAGHDLKGPLCSIAGTNIYGGPVTIGGPDNVFITTNGDSIFTISGVILGSTDGTLVFHKFNPGNGLIQLSAANTFTSSSISIGDTILRKTASVNIFPDILEVFINQHSTLDLNSFSETVGGITGENGGCSILLGNGTLSTGANNTDTTTPCQISGNGGVTKVGSGTVTFTSNNNYTGTTNITAGKLIVNGQQSSSPVNLASSGFLGGNGRVGVITGGGTGGIAPGLSPGVLNVTGNVAFATSNNFNVEINGTSVGTQYDQLNVTGSVNLNNATLNINLGFTPTNGQSFTIINATGVVIGTFNGLPNGSTFSVGGNTLRIDYGTSSVVISVGTGGGNPGTGGSNGNGSGGTLAETGISIPIVALVFLTSVTSIVVFSNKYIQKRKRLKKNFR